MSQTGTDPTVVPYRVGISGLILIPWTAANTYAGILASGNAVGVASIQGIDVDHKSTNVKMKGGETTYVQAAFETDHEIASKFSIRAADYRMFLYLMNGQLTVDAADSFGPEVQYWRANYNQYAPYFTLIGKSTNGDPEEDVICPKCKYAGLTRNYDRDKETMWDVNFDLIWDKTYLCQDGSTGGAIIEYVFANGATPGLHS